MSYAQGDIIDASDYNNLIGTDPSSTTNRINTVWATGSGSAGYGQTAIGQASTGGTVTATQWASLINTLNSIRTHQTGSGSGITAVVSGNKIDFLSNLTTVIAAGYTSRLAFASNSAVTAAVGGTLSTAWTVTVSPPSSNPPGGGSSVTSVTRAFGTRCTFASADQARYFFNAGGRLKLNLSGTQNSSTTARTNEIISLLGFAGGVATFGANTNGGRTGAGATLVTNDTTDGYWTSTFNSNNTIIDITSTTTNYTSDKIYVYVNPNGNQGSYNGNGANVDFWTVIQTFSGGDNGTYSFDDSFGVNVIRTVDISWPETTNLSNTWGAVTVTSL
jgi:hypothetical protein